ncbi:hypothetical protein Krac_10417 [Ktedonobacter racemifer DSM 44963]|uniref:Uncharacterized protein n=1 Tax=Ktedonobacter racemifer DSM 44963 TaxID=485913 RepID=D6TGX8_KTERA|nr:hypothetical protein Krac_10417 [Ktedonobacter racemifer DSM 44963]
MSLKSIALNLISFCRDLISAEAAHVAIVYVLRIGIPMECLAS